MNKLINRITEAAFNLQKEASRQFRWKLLISEQEKLEPKMARRLEAFLIGQANRVVMNLNAMNMGNADRLLDWEKEDELFKKLIRPFIEKSFLHGASVGNIETEEIEKQNPKPKIEIIESFPIYYDSVFAMREQLDDVEFLGREASRQAIDNALDAVTTLVRSDTKKRIQLILDDAITDGTELKEVQRRILAEFNNEGVLPSENPAFPAERRAVLIARTEIIKALNEGARRVYEDSGFLKDINQQFTTTRFRQENGVSIPVGEGEKLMGPPAHPQCRCTIALEPDAGMLIWIAGADERTCEVCVRLEADSEALISQRLNKAA